MQNGEGANGLIRFDAVEIDGEGHRLRVAGVEVPLERKAFAVLLLLARHPGRVFTRDEILDAVWGHTHVTPGVLNRIMTLLRQALGESGESHRYLHTVHGVGYRFDRPVDARSDAEPVATVAVDDAAPAEPGTATIPATPREVAGTMLLAQPKRRLGIVLGVLALFAVLTLAGWMLRPRALPAPTADDALPLARSIAVLPLAHVGGGEEQRALTDGLSENLITTLSQFEGLKVIGRSSSFRFRDSKEDSKSIGAKLGVTHLIEGSVQRAGDDVRIGIQLVRTADDSTVWTQRFDRPYKDLFTLQDEITLAVAGALQVRLLHAMPGAVETGRPASGNLEAYNAYLRGTHHMSGGRDLHKAIEQYAEATRLDPGYTQAWSWLGFVRTQHARYSLEGEAARMAYAQARREIETALKQAPDFGQAHSILANLLSTAEHDWNGALAEFRKALPLVPDSDPSHGAVSRLLATLGKVGEAIKERHKYIEGDPLAGFSWVYLAELQASLGQLDAAEASLREAMEVDPDNAGWYAGERSYLAILRGDADAALAEAKLEPAGRWQDHALALALQIGNDRAAADAALQHLIEIDGQGKGGAYAIARVYALRGDADKAFEWLQRDQERNDAGVYSVLFDPLLLYFRDDPRFVAYCRKAGLPLPSESEALGIDRIRPMSAVAR